jgi:hypothetical protein
MSVFWLQDPTVLFNNAGITQIIPTAGMTREDKLNAISRLIIVLTVLGYLLTMSYKLLLLGAVSLGMIAFLNSATVKSNAIIAQKKQEKQDKQDKQNNKPSKKEGFANYANYNTGHRVIGGGGSSSSSGGGSSMPMAAPAPSGLTFQAPTPQDPLMNVLLTDIPDRPGRPAAEPAFNPNVEHDINQSAQKFVVDDLGGSPDLEDRLFRDLGDNYEFSNSMRNYFATPNTKIPNDQHAFAKFCYGSMISCKEGNMMACARANPVLGSITGAQ